MTAPILGGRFYEPNEYLKEREAENDADWMKVEWFIHFSTGVDTDWFKENMSIGCIICIFN